MAQKQVFSFVVKGTTKQVNEMYDLMNFEYFKNTNFRKYYDVLYGSYGIMCFHKKTYFVSHNGNDDYEDALWRYRKGA